MGRHEELTSDGMLDGERWDQWSAAIAGPACQRNIRCTIGPGYLLAGSIPSQQASSSQRVNPPRLPLGPVEPFDQRLSLDPLILGRATESTDLLDIGH